MAGLGGESAYGAAPRLARPLHRRCAAGFLTALLMAALVLIFVQGTLLRAIHRDQPAMLVKLDKDVPKPPPVTPILVQPVKPVAVNAAPPQFIIAPDPILQTPPAPAAMISTPVAPAPAPPAAAADPGVDLVAIARAYIVKVHDRLNEKLICSSFALRLNKEDGVAVVHIAMTKDGVVLSEALKKSSGFWNLDSEAMAVVKRAQPLPPIPPILRRETLETDIPIACQLAGSTMGAVGFRR